MALSWISILGLTLLATSSLGYPYYQAEVPNGKNVPHPCKVNYRWPGLGHENPNGGGERNVFGKDFDAAGHMWTQELCRKDSDGDGFSNGEELGDPFCTWSNGQVPSRIVNITHPGVCQPFDSPQCAGRNDFVDCNVVTFDDCDRIKEPGVEEITLRYPSTRIPNAETNYYCMSFDLPADRDNHLVAYEAFIDNQDVMHHMLLFGCQDDYVDDTFNTPRPCGMGNGGCSDIIALWAVGSAGQCLPDNVGYRFGATSYKRVLLQMHWNNPRLLTDYTDSSGIKLYYQPVRPEINDLATFLLGQRMLDIPPGYARDTEIGTCPGDCTQQIFTQPLYITQAVNHMHYLGQSMTVELFRNGRKVTNITYEEFYSYDSPEMKNHNPPIQVFPGDEIRATCVFNSLSSDRHVYYGDGTADEMCLGFLMMYPAQALTTRNCVQLGPLSSCDLKSGTPREGCNWAQFLNPAGSMATYYKRLERDCSLNGYCRPECRQVVQEISQSPCMQGPMKQVITYFLSRSLEGQTFLGLYHSCDNVSSGDPAPGICNKDSCGC